MIVHPSHVTVEPTPRHDQLNALARKFAERGDYARTFDEGDTWHKEAAQLRLVAQLAAADPAGYADIAQQWIDAAHAMLDARSRS